jgi:hypothetical protein
MVKMVTPVQEFNRVPGEMVPMRAVLVVLQWHPGLQTAIREMYRGEEEEEREQSKLTAIELVVLVLLGKS